MLLYYTSMWRCFGKNKKSKYQVRQSRLGGTARQWLLYPTSRKSGSKIYYECDTLIILRATLIILRDTLNNLRVTLINLRATLIILRATLNNLRGT